MRAAADVASASPTSVSAERVPVLRVEALRHRFGERSVLNDLSFSVAPGEIFGLLGANGAGKTTAFHVITGLLSPERGQLFLGGRPIPFGARELRSRIGVVFQGLSLDQKLSAEENLLLAAALHGIRGKVAKARVEELLRLAQLHERADEQVSKLSGGMRRRLELARALVHDPELLVLDEPTSGLDEASFQRLWTYLQERCREGLSILLTTHRPEEAERCDRLGILAGGRIVASDTPERIRDQVSGDVIALDVDDPVELAREVALRFSCRTDVMHRRLLIECERGHELIPRIVEAFPSGLIKAISLRKPTLADAFLRVTGVALDPKEAER